MDMTLVWRGFFLRWPDALPRKGVVVTSFDEQVLFVEFLIGEHTLLLERLAPDTVGGRKLIIPYSSILGVKITEPVGNEVLIPTGFRAPKQKAAAAG